MSDLNSSGFFSLAEAIDGALAAALPLAAFRPPGGDIRLIRQTSGHPALFQEDAALDRLAELSAAGGWFVIAPFQVSAAHPILAIRADRISRYSSEAIAPLPPNDCRVTDFPDPPESDRRERYERVFARFLAALHARENGIEKLVLARTLTRRLVAPVSPGALFVRACALYPESFVSLCASPVSGLWLGCTPELLLSGEGGHWRTVALAGTRLASAAESVWDAKNRAEQQIVVDYLRERLQAVSESLAVTPPETVRSGQLLHLCSRFSFDSAAGVGQLLALLHPSPAVCGFPKQASRDFICQHEQIDRAYYSGYLGFIEPAGQKADLYVNLRCMRLEPDRATLYAGGGLLASSTIEAEWQETCNKLGAMLALLAARA